MAFEEYTLHNLGPSELSYSLTTNADWVVLGSESSGLSGALEPSETLVLEIEVATDFLVTAQPGQYAATISFASDAMGGDLITREVRLTVHGPEVEEAWVTEIEQYGVTWSFEEPVLSGRFVGGDFWVLGPATVQAISPSPTGTRHGSMLNPRPQDDEHASAFDSRVPYAEMDLQAQFPLTLQPGDSLVSTISHPEDPFPVIDVLGKQLGSNAWVRSAAVLTALEQPPSSTAFRPPYAYAPEDYPEGVKPMFDFVDLRWDALPDGMPATDGALAFHPDASLSRMEQMARFFERPWILTVENWVGRQTHPSENMPNYHREVYNVIADASLLLLTDASPAEKRDLMIGFIQVGIDMMGSGLYGSADSSMHKWPTMFAGIVLDEPWMMQGSNHGYRTDFMTYYPNERSTDVDSAIVPDGQGWTGATVLWRQKTVASPVTEHEHLHPTEWQTLNTSSGGGKKREAYRRSNSYTWPGVALAAHAMDATEAWDHPQFFDYVERWMEEDDAANMEYLEDLFDYSLYIGGGQSGSPFVTSMWEAHRDAY